MHYEWEHLVYDALSLAAFADELNESYIGGRIQQVLQVDALTIAFEVYAVRQRHWLTMSAHPTEARLLITSQRAGGDPERVSPLLLLLRKHARGGRIVAVSQPRYERILRVSIAKPREADNSEAGDGEREETLEHVHTELFVELMGRRSNIIYTDADGRILDAVKRVTPEMSRVRPIRPGSTYTPPPPQSKADPLAASAVEILRDSADNAERLDKWLVSRFLAVSPQLAREVVARTGLIPGLPTSELTRDGAEALERALSDVFGPMMQGNWSPACYTLEDGSIVFSPIRLVSIEGMDGVEIRACKSIADAAEMAWQAERDGPRTSAGSARHAVRRARLLEEVREARERIANRVRSLEEQVERAAAAEGLRMAGEAIYASISTIHPRQTILHTYDGRVIELDPQLSASKNAQEYFERYRKARSAEENVPLLIETARRELAYVDQLRLMVEQADSYDEIESVRIEWVAFASETPGIVRASQPKGARPAASARRPRAFILPGGQAVYVGRTGRQNDTVTFDIANSGDLWLHARDMPGAHVILRMSGSVDEAAIEQAAALAGWYSDGRLSTSVLVDVTERRHVRKIKGSGPGMVTYRNERTLNVRPMSEENLGLMRAN